LQVVWFKHFISTFAYSGRHNDVVKLHKKKHHLNENHRKHNCKHKNKMEDDFPIGADFLDEAAAAEAETTRAREERKQARVKLGLDSRTEGTDGVDIEAVAALSLPEREARWGFTSEELASATKVVSRLFTQPHLFVGDPVLADTRLFTMISRDRAT
jgi:hypothetical protein